MNDGNQLAKSIFQDEYKEQKTFWSKQIASYTKQLKLSLTDVSQMTTASLTKIIKEWDTQQWLNEIKGKETLKIYGKYKIKITEEEYFTNDEESKLMFRAGTNTLDINWRNKHFRGQTEKCPYCPEQETLQHFLLDCNAYNEIRAQHPLLAKPYNVDTDEIIADFLLFKKFEKAGDVATRKKILQNMWKKRQCTKTS